MNERLSISKWEQITTEDVESLNPSDIADDFNRLLTEALRARASEDALKKCVRVLEDAVRAALAEVYTKPEGVVHKHLTQALAGGKEET
jgi:hexokinase